MCTHFVYYFSYLIKVVALLYFICCYQQVLVNKDIHYLNLTWCTFNLCTNSAPRSLFKFV